MQILLPLSEEKIEKLKIGDEVFLTGVIYTVRDQAHKRLIEALRKKEKLPFDLKGAIIYYCGPTQTPKGKIIGSCGPTTASRMDIFSLDLLKAGLKGMIGKGNRSEKVRQAIKKYNAIYFLTYAGCGALLSQYIKKKKLIAYPDLGPEGIYELKVENFPLIVGIDSQGRSVYEQKRW